MAKKILVAENDIDTLFLISIFLSREGYDVQGLLNGSELMNQEDAEVDPIILDNELSGIDGIALCKYVKAQKMFKTIPVIIISGDYGIEEKALKAGAEFFIPKPIVPDELLKVVKDCLAIKSMFN